uniref:Uncharacterized protein n=1 Tax=Arundo donax TaxID=35708 RepID=A0A0A9FAZ4_ARUDO
MGSWTAVPAVSARSRRWAPRPP